MQQPLEPVTTSAEDRRRSDVSRLPRRLRTSELELVLRCRGGDNRAWSELVDRFQDLVVATARRVGLEEDDAADVAQEVWIDLHRRIRTIESPEALPRWLEVATRRLSYKYAARHRRFIYGQFRNLPDPGILPDELASDEDARLRIERALDRLGGKCAELLRELFYRTGPQGYKEVARRSGMAVGSIGPIRGRCLERLRRVLKESEGMSRPTVETASHRVSQNGNREAVAKR